MTPKREFGLCPKPGSAYAAMTPVAPAILLALAMAWVCGGPGARAQAVQIDSRFAPGQTAATPESAEYRQVQRQLAQGWNSWETDSVMTQVLLPEGLAIHASLKHNTTVSGDAYLENALIGRLTPGAEVVTPGPHSWNGSYTDLRIAWHGHEWRMQSAQDGKDLVFLATPLGGESEAALRPGAFRPPSSLRWIFSGTARARRRAGPIRSRRAGRRERFRSTARARLPARRRRAALKRITS